MPRPRKKHAGGRPSKIDDAIVQEICKLLAIGSYRVVAAEAAGITYGTFKNWYDAGKENAAAARLGKTEELNDYGRFFLAVKKAERDAEVRSVLNIQKAAQKDWKAAAWMLARRGGKRWLNKDTQAAQEAAAGAPRVFAVKFEVKGRAPEDEAVTLVAADRAPALPAHEDEEDAEEVA